ncbi:DUF6266 family protein [Flavobacterium sp. U410]
MGTYNKGILGAFSGKVGPVVGASWRGKEVLRSLPKKANREATPTQALQRLKFSTVAAFLNPLYPLLSRYYGNNTGEKTRLNQAMSYHMKEATVYNDPVFDMIYAKVQISKGDLLGVQAGSVASTVANTVTFTWTDNSGQGQAVATDQLIAAIYEPTTKTTLYALAVANRSAGTGAMIVPAGLVGLTVEVWAGFASADEKKYATSSYLGSVVVV